MLSCMYYTLGVSWLENTGLSSSADLHWCSCRYLKRHKRTTRYTHTHTHHGGSTWLSLWCVSSLPFLPFPVCLTCCSWPTSWPTPTTRSSASSPTLSYNRSTTTEPALTFEISSKVSHCVILRVPSEGRSCGCGLWSHLANVHAFLFVFALSVVVPRERMFERMAEFRLEVVMFCFSPS